MPLSRVQVQVINGSVISTVSGSVLSSGIVFDPSDMNAMLHLSSSTAGTPAAGDYVDWYIQYETGGQTGQGAATHAFDTTEHAQYLGRTDNYAANTPGEQPAQKSVPINCAPYGFKLYAIGSANANLRNQTLYAVLSTLRAA